MPAVLAFTCQLCIQTLTGLLLEDRHNAISLVQHEVAQAPGASEQPSEWVGAPMESESGPPVRLWLSWSFRHCQSRCMLAFVCVRLM